MATQLQLRKGTTSDNDSFIGAEGELTYDTETKGLRIHDGVKQGGNLIDIVIDFQLPTAENNYTWYRLYSSGWVEQGGYGISGSSGGVTLPVEMADTHYHLTFGGSGASNNNNIVVVGGYNKTTTGFTIQSNVLNNAGSSAATSSSESSWQVSGMAA